jgi:hypothetical protein
MSITSHIKKKEYLISKNIKSGFNQDFDMLITLSSLDQPIGTPKSES